MLDFHWNFPPPVAPPDPLLEMAAEAHHDVWSQFVYWTLTRTPVNPDGTVTLPKALVDRWWAQQHTPWAELSERDRAWHRLEGARFAQLIHTLVARRLQLILDRFGQAPA